VPAPPLREKQADWSNAKRTPMTDRVKAPSGPRSSRAQRLGAALRENLKRRKAQAKGRVQEEGRTQNGQSGAPEAPNSARFSGDKPDGKA
jgi:hypothetical protein